VAAGAVCPKEGWKSPALDGEVYAEPLVYDGVVLVATENDSVYALNATSGFILWRTNLGTPMPGSALPCGDINPSGITGTPVIDPKTGTIYVVAFQTPGDHYLVAVNVKDGGVRFSQFADPPGSDPLVEQERGALLLGNGRVYIPYGGLAGDCGDYHGWVVGLNADGSGGMISYEVPSQREAGIWAPSGGAMDSSGNLFVATGNSASDSAFDYGNSVVELSPSLQPLGYFAPTDWLQLNQGDTDLGSVGPAFVSNSVLFQIGKEGVGYLLNPSDLGGIGGQEFSGQVCSSAFGGTAVSGGVVFVPCTDGLVALLVSSNSFQVLWKDSGFPAGPPIATGNVVWALDTSTGVLKGYNASTGASLFAFSVGEVTRFTTPSAGDGSILVAAGEYLYSFHLP
jgi:outer membrane protein assembly factor BamB